jgi:predicted RecA/RadA family phage recombinase
MADFLHDGVMIDYTPVAAVTAGDVVVIGSIVGVAKSDIAAAALGALAIEGVFLMPKTAGSSSAIAVGSKVYWDATNEVVTTTASTHKVAGYTVLAATDDDTTVRVKLARA